MALKHPVVRMPTALVSEPPKRLAAGELVKKLCQCVGLASLILVMNYGDLLGGGADVRMHVPFGLTGIAMAQLVGILLLGVILFLILVPLSRTRIYPWVKLVLAMLAPPYLIWRMQMLMPFIVENGLAPIIFAIWAAFVVLLLLSFRRLYKMLMRAGDMIGIGLAVFALFSITQLLWVMHWKHGPYRIHAAWAMQPAMQSSAEPDAEGGVQAVAAQPPRQHPLLVWVIFDELSYDQVFEHRAHSLELPNFDALRQMSTVFTNVQPVGYKTVKIIPSLLTGHAVDDYRFRFDNSFVVHDEGVHGWQPVNGSNSIFGDAKRAGWRTAVVGWYNPYCTIYGDAIDDCYFMNLDRIDGLMAQRDSFMRNAWSPLEQVVREIHAPAHATRHACNYDVKQRLKTDLDLQRHWTQLLKTDQADFVFLHLSVPHSPNVWSRMKDNYTQQCDSSYLDNLALADKVLGQMLDILKSSARWKDTTMIVEGDHGWRIDLWNWLSAWTDEDDAASHDVFDPRPAVLIHQAGQTQPQAVTAPWPLIQVHGVAEQVIHGQAVQY
jgi:hypothetical protein